MIFYCYYYLIDNTNQKTALASEAHKHLHRTSTSKEENIFEKECKTTQMRGHLTERQMLNNENKKMIVDDHKIPSQATLTSAPTLYADTDSSNSESVRDNVSSTPKKREKLKKSLDRSNAQVQNHAEIKEEAESSDNTSMIDLLNLIELDNDGDDDKDEPAIEIRTESNESPFLNENKINVDDAVTVATASTEQIQISTLKPIDSTTDSLNALQHDDITIVEAVLTDCVDRVSAVKTMYNAFSNVQDNSNEPATFQLKERIGTSQIDQSIKNNRQLPEALEIPKEDEDDILVCTSQEFSDSESGPEQKKKLHAVENGGSSQMYDDLSPLPSSPSISSLSSDVSSSFSDLSISLLDESWTDSDLISDGKLLIFVFNIPNFLFFLSYFKEIENYFWFFLFMF